MTIQETREKLAEIGSTLVKYEPKPSWDPYDDDNYCPDLYIINTLNGSKTCESSVDIERGSFYFSEIPCSNYGGISYPSIEKLIDFIKNESKYSGYVKYYLENIDLRKKLAELQSN